MPSRLGLRFALEALFILAVAVAVGFAHLAAKWIVLVMVGAWLLVSLVELAATQPRFAGVAGWRRVFVRPKRRAAATPAAPASAETESEPAAFVAPPPAPEAAAEPTPASPDVRDASVRKRRFWQRSRRPRREPAAAAPAPPDTETSPAAEPEAPEPAPEPVPVPHEPEPQPATEAAAVPEQPASASTPATVEDDVPLGQRRTRYTLEPLPPRPRRFVMPWRRRREEERLGVAEPKPPKRSKEQRAKPPKKQGSRRGLRAFGRGKNEPAEEKSSEEP